MAFAEGFYGGLSANRFDADIIEGVNIQGSSWGGEVGYSFSPYLSTELRAAPPWIDTSVTAGPVSVDVDGYSFSLVAVPTHPLTDKISLYVIMGILMQEIDVQWGDTHFKETRRDGLWGAGIQYNHGNNYLRLEGSANVEGDMSGITLGMGLRF